MRGVLLFFGCVFYLSRDRKAFFKTLYHLNVMFLKINSLPLWKKMIREGKGKKSIGNNSSVIRTFLVSVSRALPRRLEEVTVVISGSSSFLPPLIS